jgi:hypothetical protein
VGTAVRSFFLGYWIPPSDPNPGRPWNIFGDVVYAENTQNAAYTGAFFGVDGSGPLDALPSGNLTSGGVYRHWCRWLRLLEQRAACQVVSCQPDSMCLL